MKSLRLLIIAIPVICVLALAAFALARPQDPGDDVIIIKGNSMTIQCGNAIGTECLPFDATAKAYRSKKDIERIVVKDSKGKVLGTFIKGEHFPDGTPTIEVTYK